jgi:hypothetical protein
MSLFPFIPENKEPEPYLGVKPRETQDNQSFPSLESMYIKRKVIIQKLIE